MKLTIHLSDDSKLEWEDFDADSLFELRDEMADQQLLTFEMDQATVIVNRDHIVRMDVES